ncbi:hypothetical protein [Pseudomonas sp. PGPR40]|nr:hypothetical protein [Pseudomonas sp. PGPR40]
MPDGLLENTLDEQHFSLADVHVAHTWQESGKMVGKVVIDVV